MNILMVNARNDTNVSHSRKGMYVPLGILSVATFAAHELGDRVAIEVVDEDVEALDADRLAGYDVVGFYSTTFNYGQSVAYAEKVKEAGGVTVFAGPHPTALPLNVVANKRSVDYVIAGEGEVPFRQLLSHLLGDAVDIDQVPNLIHRGPDGTPRRNSASHENDLQALPIPSRAFVPMERYIDNYRQAYPQHGHLRHGSILTSKGCHWRDKTNGGCVFCARHDDGLRFRGIDQLWQEIRELKADYGVNYIWDAADDSLNDTDWFMEFVDRRPRDLEDIGFFIYSRVTPIRPRMIEYFKRLNVDEVYLGVESGDTTVLKSAVKGQSLKSIRRALKLIGEGGMRYFPSFVLGLPGESIESLEATYRLCEEIVEQGALDRASATILMPIPGSPSFARLLERLPSEGVPLDKADEIDLPALERYWADHFTEVDHATLVEYKTRIDELMADTAATFGTAEEAGNLVAAE